jgi:hypothetical protein
LRIAYAGVRRPASAKKSSLRLADPEHRAHRVLAHVLVQLCVARQHPVIGPAALLADLGATRAGAVGRARDAAAQRVAGEGAQRGRDLLLVRLLREERGAQRPPDAVLDVLAADRPVRQRAFGGIQGEG